jgi:peptidoglycan/LPS O-acetylase OafA/YrhL
MSMGSLVDKIPTDRMDGIQALRAIAAISVILGHLHHEFAEKFQMPNALPNMDIGSMGVDLFFVISGFIIVYSSENLFGKSGAPLYFLSRRIIRIVPIYWLASLILLLWVATAHGGFDEVKWTSGMVIASFFFWPYDSSSGQSAPFVGVGWTLYFEMFFYVTFSMTVFMNRERAVAATAALFIFLLLAGAAIKLPQPLLHWSNPVIIEFIFGMIIALLYRQGVRIQNSLGAVMVGIGFLLAIIAFWVQGDLAYRYITLGVPSALIIGAVATSTRSLPRVTAPLLLLGNASYSLYLFHPYAFTIPRLVFGRYLSPEGHVYEYALLIFGVAIVAGIMMHLFVERPLTAWLRSSLEASLRLRSRVA